MALPKVRLRKRLVNEIALCRSQFHHEIEFEDPLLEKFPASIFVSIKNIPGPILKSGKIETVYDHRLKIDISEEYPYHKPRARFF
jgi:hypothetical protein